MAAREEIQQLTEQLMAAFNKGDPVPFITALDEDLEVFDHAPYRFDSKASFLAYLQGLMAGAETANIVFHQPSYRAFNDNTGIVNAYDILTLMPKGGGTPQVQANRTTYVYVKKGGQWKIVSAHFSPLPQH
ncbi:MAG: nuclear transport factor 2 family protein [Deltaproteobacteria bacterium]|nr:nuclear transport factor 2 family protein [Deltaproteobacteria bacterium]